MLENQCLTWPDPLVAAVHLPLARGPDGAPPLVPSHLNTTLRDVLRGADAFHVTMEGLGACALRLLLLGQFADAADPEPYPINALRNRALAAVQTELVLLLDVDFVASPLLGLPPPAYRDPRAYAALLEWALGRRAAVLPAFEMVRRKQDLPVAQNFARALALAGKPELARLYAAGEVDAFNGRDAPWGHGPSNTSRWVAEPAGAPPYAVVYEPMYEPFIVVATAVAPAFDERFVGYGGNKVSYMAQLHGAGWTFWVSPSGFSVHVPHPRTRAANAYVADKRRGVAEMNELRELVAEEVRNGTVAPVVRGCTA